MRLMLRGVCVVVVAALPLVAFGAQRGRGGGGGGRPAAPMARPAAPMARPAAPQMSRPQMPAQRPQQMARPQMPMQRPQQMTRPQMPQQMARPSMPMQRPNMQMQRPNPSFQRPNLGGMPNMSRPSLPSAGMRPMPSPQMRPGMTAARPGLGSLQSGGGPGLGARPLPGGMNRPGGLPGGGNALNRPGGLPGNLGPGMASRPGGGFAGAPTPSLRPGSLGGGAGGGQLGGGNASTLPGRPGLGRPGLSASTRPAERPSLGAATKPFPQPGGLAGGNRPGGGGGAGGGGAGGGGGTNRPVTLPGQLGGGGAGGTNRPVTLPGQIGGGGGGNRPGGGLGGGGGNRPGVGGNRPTTLPGQIGGGNRPGIGGDRPGGLNRPGGGNWANRPGERPGIGGNRPGIGGGNRPGIGDGIGNNIGNNVNNNFNNVNVNGGGWGYPGYGGGYGGYGDWGYGGYGGWNNWNSGYVNPHYGGWYSGCWNNNWGGGWGGGWWAPFALGAATYGAVSTLGGWGLGYGLLGYGSGAYVNPYYSSIPATVVASSPYDYSQPVVVNNYVTNDGDLSNSSNPQGGAGGNATATATSDEANAVVDDALAKFKAGDYQGALAGFDRAVKLSPKDSIVHEVRALTLFALGRYPEAAATLNAVLVGAPGMDWTTISNVYGSVDAYTGHLRKLEDYCRSNPDSAAGHFVLAYHYLVGGHADMASEALKVVVAKQPGDMVAKRLLEAITPPPEEEPKAEAAPAAGEAAATPPDGPETDLVGTWKATSGNDTIVLSITEDSKFTWKATPAGRPAIELSGDVVTARDAIALNTEKQGSMVGKVQSKGPDAFEFSLAGAPKEAKPLLFQRQK